MVKSRSPASKQTSRSIFLDRTQSAAWHSTQRHALRQRFRSQFCLNSRFSTYKFVSIVAAALDCLPVAFQATFFRSGSPSLIR